MKYYAALNAWVLGGFGGERDAFACIDDAAEFGMDGVELTIGDVVPWGTTAEECRRIREYARERGIGLRSVASGCGWSRPLSAPNEEARRDAVAMVRDYLRIAAELGAECALVIPGVVNAGWDPACPVTPAPVVWRQATKSIRELLPVAAECKVAIACENVWSKFLTDPFAMRQFIDQFESPWVGAYLDVANCLNVGYPQDWIDILGERIKGVHFKNWKSEDFGGGLHGFGEDITVGEADFPAILAALDRIGYRGPVTVEMIPFSRLPDMVLPDRELGRAAAGRLREILAR